MQDSNLRFDEMYDLAAVRGGFICVFCKNSTHCLDVRVHHNNNAIHYVLVQDNTMQCNNTMQYNAIQQYNNTIQYNTIQHNTVQHNTTRYYV